MSIERIRRVKELKLQYFRDLPGCTGVGIGKKEVRGQQTDTEAIRVYVLKKKQVVELAEHEIVPREIDGCPTDVIEKGWDVPLVGDGVQEDATSYRPLKGGCQIAVDGILRREKGTLGCFVNVDGKVHLLTAAHIGSGTHLSSGKFFQPKPASCGCCDYVAKSGWSKLEGTVDCRIAPLEEGVEWTAAILDLEVPGPTGSRAVTTSDVGLPVFKRGRTTRYTNGFVFDVNYTSMASDDDPELTDQILVNADIAHGSDAKFAAKGDSGAVVVDMNGMVLGLVVRDNRKNEDTPEGRYVVCNKITNVQAELAKLAKVDEDKIMVEIISQGTEQPAHRVVGVDRAKEFERAASAVKSTPIGLAYYELAERLADEGYALVNANKRVATKWHRNFGPEFSRAIYQGILDPSSKVPTSFGSEKRSLQDCIDGFAEELVKHASPPFAKAIHAARPDATFVLEHLGESMTFDQGIALTAALSVRNLADSALRDFGRIAKQGYPELDIPKLDPFALSETPAQRVKPSWITGEFEGTLKGLLVHGISSLKAKPIRVDMDEPKVLVDFDLGAIRTTGALTIKGVSWGNRLIDLSVDFTCTISSISCRSTSRLDVRARPALIKDMKLNVSLGTVNVEVRNVNVIISAAANLFKGLFIPIVSEQVRSEVVTQLVRALPPLINGEIRKAWPKAA